MQYVLQAALKDGGSIAVLGMAMIRRLLASEQVGRYVLEVSCLNVEQTFCFASKRMGATS